MKPPTGLGIAADLAPAFHLAGQFQVILDVVLEIVRVHEVLAGVVGRVDVDQLDLAGIALLQQLQHFQVVALDHQVLRAVPVHAVFRAGAQGAGAGGERQLPGAALAMPVEAVFLLAFFHRAAQQLLQHLEIHLAFAEGFREQGLERVQVAGDEVGGTGFGVVGFDFLHGHSRFIAWRGQRPVGPAPA